MKQKVVFVCQNCGAQRPRWEGRCQECGSWNTLVAETIVEGNKSIKSWIKETQVGEPKNIFQISNQDQVLVRYPSKLAEFNRVLGGGTVPGQLILIGGPPGIGKSTLLLQWVGSLQKEVYPILYVSGEESLTQTADRARRLGVNNPEIFFQTESRLHAIQESFHKLKPKALVIDSIQTIYSENLPGSPGTVSQVRECAHELLQIAKSTGCIVILVGHVTKEGHIAGPRVLEHMVDTVLYFEGEENSEHRILRTIKNRFGPTGEIGIFRMSHIGLQDVENPGDIFISHHQSPPDGSSLFCSLEGTRPFLCEIQSLAVKSYFPSPRRTSVGFDLQRLHLIVAIIEKHLGISLSDQDLYLSVVGGFQIQDTAADLAVVASIISLFRKKKLKQPTCFLGEVALTGEIRGVKQIELRLKEILRTSQANVITSFLVKESLPKNFKHEHRLQFINHIQELKSIEVKEDI